MGLKKDKTNSALALTCNPKSYLLSTKSILSEKTIDYQNFSELLIIKIHNSEIRRQLTHIFSVGHNSLLSKEINFFFKMKNSIFFSFVFALVLTLSTGVKLVNIFYFRKKHYFLQIKHNLSMSFTGSLLIQVMLIKYCSWLKITEYSKTRYMHKMFFLYLK